MISNTYFAIDTNHLANALEQVEQQTGLKPMGHSIAMNFPVPHTR